MNALEEIQGLDTLHGWCTPEKQKALCELVLKVKPKLVCEVGCWSGKSAFPMALALQQNGSGKIIVIDPWSPQASSEGQTTQQDEEWWSQQNHEIIYQSFLYQMKRLKLESFFEVHREKSSAVEIPEGVEVLHLDGNHGPEALEDAKRFAPKVKLGGYCILDDIGWTGGYVRRAADFIKLIGFVEVRPLGTGALYQRMEMGSPPSVDIPPDPRSPVKKILSPREEAAKNLTIGYITGRKNPNLQWFFDSLQNQDLAGCKVIVVSANAQPTPSIEDSEGILWTLPKPTIWQGKHRITKEDWWACSNARNTAICLCETEWLACVDDRCVLMPGWGDAVIDAITGNYALCGTYQKRINMEVNNGFITNGGTIIGEDHRALAHPQGLKDCPGEWMFGCTFAVKLEWALEVNGFSEDICDGMGGEDCYFGRMIKAHGHPMNFDPRFRIIEDRTPAEITDVMKRTDKGVSPLDKSHKAKDILWPAKTSQNSYDIRKVRNLVQTGQPFPPPTAQHVDWFDNQPISEMVAP